MSSETIIQALFGLMIASYGFIFKSILGRISKVEERHVCQPENCAKRFEKIEDDQDRMNPILLEIKTKLATIEEAVMWLKKTK